MAQPHTLVKTFMIQYTSWNKNANRGNNCPRHARGEKTDKCSSSENRAGRHLAEPEGAMEWKRLNLNRVIGIAAVAMVLHEVEFLPAQ
jgi:hypothetical protein